MSKDGLFGNTHFREHTEPQGQDRTSIEITSERYPEFTLDIVHKKAEGSTYKFAWPAVANRPKIINLIRDLDERLGLCWYYCRNDEVERTNSDDYGITPVTDRRFDDRLFLPDFTEVHVSPPAADIVFGWQCDYEGARAAIVGEDVGALMSEWGQFVISKSEMSSVGRNDLRYVLEDFQGELKRHIKKPA